LCLI
jgi:hypothetical protein